MVGVLHADAANYQEEADDFEPELRFLREKPFKGMGKGKNRKNNGKGKNNTFRYDRAPGKQATRFEGAPLSAGTSLHAMWFILAQDTQTTTPKPAPNLLTYAMLLKAWLC